MHLRRTRAERVELPEQAVRARSVRAFGTGTWIANARLPPGRDRVRGAAVEHVDLDAACRDELRGVRGAAAEADGRSRGIRKQDAEAERAAAPRVEGLTRHGRAQERIRPRPANRTRLGWNLETPIVVGWFESTHGGTAL